MLVLGLESVAAVGIGQAAALLFARRGDHVVATARRADRLRALVSGLEQEGLRASLIEADLTRAQAPDELLARVETEHGRLDVLVNNAGFGAQLRYERMPSADIELMFRVNVLAPMALACWAIPMMRRTGRGAIVNVASLGGLVAHPLNVAYCATKHALVGFSKSLCLELAGTGIHVVAVCPGATRTEFFERAERDIPFASFIERNMVTPEAVARAIVRASEGGSNLVLPSAGAWFLVWADRWLGPLSRRGNIAYPDRALAALDARRR